MTQARDARAALDALREEHSERIRREAEEAERQRQMQMALKLEIMRKKKQEYLQYQRQLAMQRMQVIPFRQSPSSTSSRRILICLTSFCRA